MTSATTTTDIILRLRADLDAAHYSVAGLTGLWGMEADAALQRNQRVPARRALAALAAKLGRIEPAATLARLFLLGDAVPRADSDAALSSLGSHGAEELGLVTAGDDLVRPLVDLRPYSFVDAHGAESWWIVSDLGELALGHPLGQNHVLGIGGASRTLSGLMLPTPVRRALDIGTGCGIQAMHASRHAEHVVATDISVRALELAALNATLNAIDNIEFRFGSLFEPVAGERFDHIISNPPFVITPRGADVPSYEYRDGGLVGDALVEAVVRGAAEHLNPDGVAQLLGNWEYHDQTDAFERLEGWLTPVAIAATPGADSAGTDSAGAASAGAAGAGTDTAAADGAGTDGAVTDGAGTDAAGVDSAGTDSAGTDGAGTASAGTDSAGTDSAGTDGAGTDSAGADTAGTDSAGTDSAGTDSAGTDSAGAASAGADTAAADGAGTDGAVALDAWIIEREVQSPGEYAETWIRDGGTRPGDDFDRLYNAWLNDFDARGVRQVGFGYVLLRRPSADASGDAPADGPADAAAAAVTAAEIFSIEPTLRRLERLPDALGHNPAGLGVHLAGCLAAHDWQVRTDDSGLLRTNLVLAADVTEERHYWPGQPDPMVMTLHQGSGFGRSVPLDTALAGLVGTCDGDLAVGAIIGALAQLLDADEVALTAELLPQLRGLLADGFLSVPEPVPEPEPEPV